MAFDLRRYVKQKHYNILSDCSATLTSFRHFNELIQLKYKLNKIVSYRTYYMFMLYVLYDHEGNNKYICFIFIHFYEKTQLQMQ